MELNKIYNMGTQKESGKRRAMGSHQSARFISESWITPKYVTEALGHFGLDPCTPPIMPWEHADKRYTEKEDGLKSPWYNARIWLNPPYGNWGEWMEKLYYPGNGIALLFARTETKDFFKQVWERADAILFLKGRLTFYRPDGTLASSNGGAPSCLIAYGENNVECLRALPLKGKFIQLK